jgi:hypothetical protein
MPKACSPFHHPRGRRAKFLIIRADGATVSKRAGFIRKGIIVNQRQIWEVAFTVLGAALLLIAAIGKHP